MQNYCKAESGQREDGWKSLMFGCGDKLPDKFPSRLNSAYCGYVNDHVACFVQEGTKQIIGGHSKWYMISRRFKATCTDKNVFTLEQRDIPF